jgi:FkbM family methyltransferase
MPDVKQPIPDHPDFKPLHSYSQDGEDILLRPLLLESIPNYNQYKGFYIDIGAHHPFRHSNTMHYYEQGWRGINIEPTPDAITLFNTYRERDINLNIGVGSQRETKTLYCFKNSALNSFDESLTQHATDEDDTYKVIGTIDVEIYPLEQILAEYLPAHTNIDFISIDVAGVDMALLQSNDWDKYRPRYILVEDVDSNFSKIDASEIYGYLAGNGYELVSKTLRTLIFKQQSPA